MISNKYRNNSFFCSYAKFYKQLYEENGYHFMSQDDFASHLEALPKFQCIMYNQKDTDKKGYDRYSVIQSKLLRKNWKFKYRL